MSNKTYLYNQFEVELTGRYVDRATMGKKQRYVEISIIDSVVQWKAFVPIDSIAEIHGRIDSPKCNE